MLPGDARTLLPPPAPTAARPTAERTAARHAAERPAARHADGLDRPRKPRSTGGPEGPWWRRPIRPD